MHEMTDEQLRDLCRRAKNDPEAQSELVMIFEDRVLGALRKYAPAAMQQKADAEDALADVIEGLWAALDRLTDPDVEFPWAYVNMVIHNRVIDVSRELARIRGHEESLEERHYRNHGQVDLLDTCADAIERWMAGLAFSHREAAGVFLTAFRRGESVKRVLLDTYPNDRAARDRIERQISRGKKQGGFIDKLGKYLSPEGD